MNPFSPAPSKSLAHAWLLFMALLCVSWFVPGRAWAAIYSVSFDNINQSIPDASPLGWSDSRSINPGIGVIQSVSVSLSIAGGFNGDIYAHLSHSSGFSVLLNRVGRTNSTVTGYPDSGFNMTFDDETSGLGDVHRYRTVLFGNETTALGGPLTGTWKTDGRAVDPDNVLDTHLRTALLSSFLGLNADGEWTLFVADMDFGGVATIQSWGLTIEGLLGVPEPGISGLLLISVAACLWRRRRSLEVNGYL